MAKKWRVAGLSFEHMHMGDNLKMVAEHPDCEVVAICDPDPVRMQDAIHEFGLTSAQVFTDWRRCIDESEPDLLVLCPATGAHADWVEWLAPTGLPMLMEKPLAANLNDADRMIAASEKHGNKLAINWPLVWVPSHRTARRLISEGRIGQLKEVHYYDGNRGPLWHTAGKREISAEEVERQKPDSWFYKASAGGGSLLDYLGYGVTLGTWFLNGLAPIEVTSVVDMPAGLEVDEHSVTVARYDFGLSKFETRWGTFTDPWTHQPQPMCGFVLVGTNGTISSFDYQESVRLQTRERPEGEEVKVDQLVAPEENPIQYMIHCLENDKPVEGPLSLEMSRIGQQIVDTAFQSAKQKKTLKLLK